MVERLFDHRGMVPTPARDAETEFANGYERGRSTCLTRGPEAAHRYLAEQLATSISDAAAAIFQASRAGYTQAVWDYEDANGLPQPPHSGPAT